MTTRQKFSAWYQRLQRRLAPSLQYAQLVFEQELVPLVPDGGDWLDVGCGHQFLPEWRGKEETALIGRAGQVIGIDLEIDALRAHRSISRVAVADASKLPFPDRSFDLVTANMVVEHLKEPEIQFAEFRRVLRPGGFFAFHTPNVYGYTTILARMIPERIKKYVARFVEGRPLEDIFPAFYRANSESRIKQLASDVGFEVEKTRLIVSSAELVMIPPLAVLELLWIKCLMRPCLRQLRTNTVGILKRIG